MEIGVRHVDRKSEVRSGAQLSVILKVDLRVKMLRLIKYT